MADLKEVLVPNIDTDEVQVIEICAAVGETLEKEASIITVETDKATMDIPAPFAGKLTELKVAVGDTVSEGTLIALMSSEESLASESAAAPTTAPQAVAVTDIAPVAAMAAPATTTASEVIEIKVPDIGGDTDVPIIDVLVAVGDTIEAEAGLITLETDKATMDVPAPTGGVVKSISVKVGDTVSEGNVVLMLEVAASADTPVNAPAAPQATAPSAPQASSQVIEIKVPDIGGDTDVPIIEVLVAVGDTIEAEAGLITLETDKATMDVPAPKGGVVESINVNVGDTVSEGSVVLMLKVAGEAPVVQPAPQPAAPVAAPAQESRRSTPPVPHHPSAGKAAATGVLYASPSVRRLAREFGVDLAQVTGTGRKKRILKEDVQAYVKYELSRPKATAATAVAGGAGGLNVIAAPKVDFSKFGEVEEKPLSRIQKISGPNLHRNWVTIPHVTQFDEADITELEAFRKDQNALAAKKKADYKITPLVFMMKAVAKTLEQFPVFNSSLSHDGESLIQKKYFHIGVAVDTPNGLVVPVVRNVDQKGIVELSRELMEISVKARDGKLKAADMQGSCFTISSLGGIGGTAFTPIVNYPDVAILGVSKSEIKPKWNGSEFEPKLMLPLSLSYDHRVIDGAMAARFSVTLSGILSDIRTMIL
ncbi:dihydrolipoyllysine-residue acetyltransferase [Shewanella intestini]|uniref:Acetyltransferase component of pyruvate dehydrogenase complex n=1 Tax=Shewanella intestini TaxID=2017544 RepID=A0ABS5I511_9GAMM|nr:MULTISPECIES: dihydrolipoyllysine-residue acetyltransferase [Shewanella]MBR9729118.1 dihydrolipoyllysine-residue acetyltransferase [Shewanella intestini]MRG37194.1 dihydrolipoyllysine-residue acetyltransferase [Shewanella sp. XMDDZSB0408]